MLSSVVPRCYYFHVFIPIKRVFLSSVAEALSEYRREVARAIDLLDDYKCVRMEDFGARDAPSEEVCRTRIAECDVLVGVLGPWYGSVVPGTQKSYSELEYDVAVELGIPRLMFLSLGDMSIGAASAPTDEDRKRQTLFRDRVSRERQCAYFQKPFDLAIRVQQALYNFTRERFQLERPMHAREEDSIVRHARLEQSLVEPHDRTRAT